MILLAGEVALALHAAVVLALGLIQNDSHPFARCKEGVADVGHRPALALADHLHQGAYFDGPAAPVWAHPAAAGGLRGDRANFLIRIFVVLRLEEAVVSYSLSAKNLATDILEIGSDDDKWTPTVISFKHKLI